ncbi:Eh domain-containing protein 4, partial [Globisporangium splendens]
MQIALRIALLMHCSFQKLKLMGAGKKASKKPPKLIAPGKAKAALAGATIGIVMHVGDALHHSDKKRKHESAKKRHGGAYRLLDDDTSKRMHKQLAAVGCKLVVRSSSTPIAERFDRLICWEEGSFGVHVVMIVSIGDQLFGDQHQHAEIRKRVVDYMELKRDDFEPFMEDEEEFEHYCKRMREDGTWGGNQELYAAARHFHVYVVIHMESSRMVIECDAHKPQKVLHVAYHGSDHYDSVRSIQDVNLDEPPQEIALDCDGFRPEDLAKVTISVAAVWLRWNGKSAEEVPRIAASSSEETSSVDALAQGLDALHQRANEMALATEKAEGKRTEIRSDGFRERKRKTRVKRTISTSSSSSAFVRHSVVRVAAPWDWRSLISTYCIIIHRFSKQSVWERKTTAAMLRRYEETKPLEKQGLAAVKKRARTKFRWGSSSSNSTSRSLPSSSSSEATKESTVRARPSPESRSSLATTPAKTSAGLSKRPSYRLPLRSHQLPSIIESELEDQEDSDDENDDRSSTSTTSTLSSTNSSMSLPAGSAYAFESPESSFTSATTSSTSSLPDKEQSKKAMAPFRPRVEYNLRKLLRQVMGLDGRWSCDQQVERHYARIHWTIRRMVADGNCLFRAISDQLYGHEMFHGDIRWRIADFIQREGALFQPFIATTEAKAETIELYCRRMKREGEWGGNLELYAAAKLFNIHIVVHQILHLLYKGDHYSSLHPPRDATDDTNDERANDNSAQQQVSSSKADERTNERGASQASPRKVLCPELRALPEEIPSVVVNKAARVVFYKGKRSSCTENKTMPPPISPSTKSGSQSPSEALPPKASDTSKEDALGETKARIVQRTKDVTSASSSFSVPGAAVTNGGGAAAILAGDGVDIAAKSKQVIDGLKKLYSTKLKPLEKKYDYDDFHSPLLSDADFDAKPQVLMIGQYSVGKTSFIEYLLGRSFPGQRIGPEPTTDRFVAVMHGEEERTIPGNAVAVSPDLPYGGLSMFGTAFLNKFEAAQVPCKVLENITVVDTPGILSGEKQRIARGYDFVQVARRFAERLDTILLLFDAHKLDISGEFQRVIEVLKNHDDKIRCILNKADQIGQQRLMRVCGALMWSMGKVVKTPEVMRVFIGSFWDQPPLHADNTALFEAEEHDLVSELRNLPQSAAVRKINEFAKRVQSVKVHAYVIGHLKEEMPAMIGKEKKQRDLIENMGEAFREVQRKYHLPPGDFPNLDEFCKKCADCKLHKFANLNIKAIQEIDELLSEDISKPMAALPKCHDKDAAVLDDVEVAPKKPEYDTIFKTLRIDASGRATGANCLTPSKASGCAQDTLKAIWDLADVDKDGCLDADEFAVAMYLRDKTKEGEVLPAELPASMVPPSKARIANATAAAISPHSDVLVSAAGSSV